MFSAEPNNIFGNVHDTNVVLPGQITIEESGIFRFNPQKIKPIRKEVFQPNHFSVFDVLLDLAEESKIDLNYHFEESMNTYIVDSINGKKNWWYRACYHSGLVARNRVPLCRERNIMPMDQFPYKDKMTIIFHRVPEKDLDNVFLGIRMRPDLKTRYKAFNIETKRRRVNDGKVIIPSFHIKGRTENTNIKNLEVKPHNLRNDIFKAGVITAADAIMTLGDEKKLSYDLTWIEKIGEAEIKDYYVTRINKDRASGKSGFTYECGAFPEYKGFKGNHIHVESDIRVLNSPTYMDFMWTSLDPSFQERHRITG